MDLTERDLADTTIENPDRREEVELTTRLIMAADESSASLSQERIGTILGVSLPG